MGILTSQEKNYVSIFIKPTIDLTTVLSVAEKGVCFAMGKLSYGNPYYATILGRATEKLQSTNVNAGGDLDNELAFHIADYFAGYKGKMLIARVIEADSTTKILKVVKNSDTGAMELDQATDINVFGTDNIMDWEDVAVDKVVEVVTTSLISKKHSIQIINKDDFLTIQLFDEFGNEVYKVEGGAKYDSVDDNGNPNFIGNLYDKKVMIVKVNPNNADYESNFTITQTFDNGLLTTSGAKNYAKALEVMSNNIEKCDYYITAGLRDATTIQSMRGIGYEAKALFVCDVIGNAQNDAITYKTTLGLGYEDIIYNWNRGKDNFGTLGNLNVGLSGWYVGQAVRRNLSKLVGDVEFRIEGIAGVDYALPRVKADDLPVLTDEQKTELTDNRINTVREFNGKLVLADVLSGNPKEQTTKLYPVVEGKFFIDRAISKIMASKFFKNLNEAKSFITENVRVLLDRCDRNDYFNSDEDVRYSFEVTKKDSDTIVVNYQYVPNGVMRKGIVSGTLTKKIEA